LFESAVTVESKNYWLLGNNFMRGFYSIYDMANS
jgi:flagellar biosynthesis/type III secretory pathway M-ring protein FliF/YscJ